MLERHYSLINHQVGVAASKFIPPGLSKSKKIYCNPNRFRYLTRKEGAFCHTGTSVGRN